MYMDIDMDIRDSSPYGEQIENYYDAAWKYVSFHVLDASKPWFYPLFRCILSNLLVIDLDLCGPTHVL